MSSEELIGLKLEEAEVLLRGADVSYKVVMTEPFFRGEPKPLEEGSLRIIRVKNLRAEQENPEGDCSLELTVCRVPNEYRNR